MPTLRLKFPEKDEPSVIALSGARVTLGRLPLNTIQIVDRTLSGFHAEFVLEDDHYRLHDRGSTNGTFVDGESVTDFHLREACKVSFGTLECEFSPETTAPADAANVEVLPTRSEVNAVRQENAELKNRVDSLREELDALLKARAPETGSDTVTVKQEDYEKVVAEREALKEAQHALNQEITRLKTDLALLQRDRENLKKVADSAKADIASFSAAKTPADPLFTLESTPPAAEKKPELAPEPAMPAAPAPAPTVPAPAAVPPPISLPKPSIPLPAAAKLAPKPPGAMPPPPFKLPVTPIAAPRATLAAASTAPAAGPAQPVPPAPTLRPLPKPLPKVAAPAPKGGTQKLDSDAVPVAKPAAPMPKGLVKPPVKLPLRPTARLHQGGVASTPDAG